MRILLALRFCLSGIFLWAFFDKLFGLGFSTPPEKSWLAGVSPTAGFLTNSPQGPFKEVFQAMSGSMVVDWLFMMGLLGLGLSLLLGIGLRVAAVSGSLLMFLMWLAVFPSKTNPLLDQHVIYALVLNLLFLENVGNHLSLQRWWWSTPVVKRFAWLG